MRFKGWLVRAVAITLLTALVVSPLLVSEPASAAPGESQVPIDNPDLDRACGLNVMVVLDASTSIATSNATEDVRDAYRAFISSLNNTGSSVATVQFASVATLPAIGTNPAGAYVTIDNTTSPAFNSYITNVYVPNGYTNWEDAMRVGRFFAPRPNPAIPHLVVFITDGDPTAYVNTSQVTTEEYRTKVPLSTNEVRTNQSSTASLGPAIPNANGLKAMGSHILAIGVGAALQNQQSVNRLIAMSGPNVFDGTGTFDIGTHDVYLEPDFSELQTALREAAFQLCAPSVSIRKLVDLTPDPGSFDDAVPGTGFEGTGTVTNMTASEFDWVLPVGADQNSTTATATTDAAGFATFQWTPANPTILSNFTVLETSDVPGFEPVAGSCTFRTPDAPDDQPFPFTVIDDGTGPVGFSLEGIPPESIVTCQIVNTADPVASMTLKKYTNGVDADEPPGPNIPLGGPVTWTYIVTNTGNLTLSDIEVTDSPAQTITCDTDTIGPGERAVCTATGVAQAGQYANTATATATDSLDRPVGPVTDPSHYFGDVADIQIKKYTVVTEPFEMRADADTFIDEDGNVIAPLVPVGTALTWEYEVTNPGTLAATNVVVSDSQGVVPVFVSGDTDDDDELDPDEMWLYRATGSAAPGAYENIGVVTAAGGLTDSDPSHYLGYVFDVQIVKYTNGRDANDPAGPDVPMLYEGDTVHWTYEITNTGNVPLAFQSVSDDQGEVIVCPLGPFPLPAGGRIVCSAEGTAVDTGLDDPYANVGTVVAVPSIPPGVTLPDGHPLIGATVSDSDPSHYIGLTSEIDIEKATNGEDADEPTGPFIPVGGGVTWSYVVSNTGSAPLTDIVAVDYRVDGGFTVLSCPQTALDPDEDMTCTSLIGTATTGQFFNSSGVVGIDPFGNSVGDTDPSHYFGAAPGIHLKKYTNGLDADDPPGAYIPVGDPVEWTYVVTNTGNLTLNQIVVTDDPTQTVSCPQTTLAPGDEMTCSATGTAVRGQYENLATATAVDAASQTVSDTDPSHYFGYIVGIDLEKSTNGEDADDPTGPVVGIGSTVTWTYVVTNPGDVPISDVVVIDDQGVIPVFQGGDTNGDDQLDPDETWTFEATGPAQLGQYANVGTVTGMAGFEIGVEVTDSDPSHYLGVEAAIQIDKTPDLAEVPRGVGHTFTIEVTNTGTVPLTDVVVTDPVTPSCDRVIGDMAVGEVVTYECDVDAVFEVIDNIAFVEGIDPEGGTVSDQDDARVIPVEVGGTGSIGDLVWWDTNANGVQDPGEEGIPGARVRIRTISERPLSLAQAAAMTPQPLAIDQTLVTDADGRYLEVALVAGTYEVTLDLSSVEGRLTTPQVYLVPLDVGDEYLDADFGLVDGDLPFTGMDAFRYAVIALSLILTGSGLVLSERSRRKGSSSA